MARDDHTLLLADGRRIAYTEWGDAAGRPVIYCHGFPGSRLEAGLADASARELGIRLIAPDRPGFGGSTFLPGRRMVDWPKDLIALADHLRLSRFHLLGVSGGAPYALAGGQALGERVTGIALVCGLGEFVGDDPTAGMNHAAAAAIEFHRRWPRVGHWSYRHLVGPTLRRFPRLIFAILLGSGNRADRKALADRQVREMFLTSFAEAFRNGAEGPAYEIDLITRPWGIDPRQVQQPVQLWHGEADRTVPVDMGRRHAELIPHVEAHFFPDEGHISLIVRHLHEILTGLTQQR